MASWNLISAPGAAPSPRPDLGAGLQRERDHAGEPPGGLSTRRNCPCAGSRGPRGRWRRLTFRNPGSAGAAATCAHLDLTRRPGALARDRGWTMAGDCRLAADGLWLLGPDSSTANFAATPGTAACSRRSWCRSAPACAAAINHGEAHQPMKVESSATAGAVAHVQASGAIELKYAGCEGWYDLEITVPDMPAFGRRLAGRIASGKPGVPDPRLRRGWTLAPWTPTGRSARAAGRLTGHGDARAQQPSACPGDVEGVDLAPIHLCALDPMTHRARGRDPRALGRIRPGWRIPGPPAPGAPARCRRC